MQIAEFKQQGRIERDRREKEGRGDRWAKNLSAVKPEINSNFVRFKIEMLFNYTHDQGLNWCHGEVIAIKNAKRKTVKVRWAEEHVGERELHESYHVLKDSTWNKS